MVTRPLIIKQFFSSSCGHLGLILDAVMIIRLKLIQCLNVRRGNLGLVLIMTLAAKARFRGKRKFAGYNA